MPRPVAQASSFEDLLRNLADEHDQLLKSADALRAENLQLRNFVLTKLPLAAAQDPGDAGWPSDELDLCSHWRLDAQGVTNGCPKLQDPSALETNAEDDPTKVAFEEDDQMVQLSSNGKAPSTPTRKASSKKRWRKLMHVAHARQHAMEEASGGAKSKPEPIPEDLEHIEACVQKLQSAFGVADRNNSVPCTDILQFLKNRGELGGPARYHVETIFTQLGCPATATVSSSHISNFDVRARAKTMSLSGAGLEESPGLEMKFTEFASLLLSEEPQMLLRDPDGPLVDFIVHLRNLALAEDAKDLVLNALCLTEFEMDGPKSPFDHACDVLVNTAILANAVCIGWFAKEEPMEWGAAQIVDLFFTVFFTIEVVFKLTRAGFKDFYGGADKSWHMFDTFLVLMGVIDTLMSLVITNVSLGFNPFQLMRMLRLVRMIRLLRVMRITIFRELKLMLTGIVGLLKTLSCAIVFLLLTVYFLAICIVQLQHGMEDDKATQDKRELVSTVPGSMFTVFRCLIIGDCSAEDGTPITLYLSESMGWPVAVFYCLAFVLMNYGLGSLITALVVDSTLNEAKKQEFRAGQQAERTKKVAKDLHDLALLFEEAQHQVDDKEGHGGAPSVLHLSRHTFTSLCSREDVKSLMDAIDIEENDRVDLFDALDADGNGHIQLEELVEGLAKMRGKARKADSIATRLMLVSFITKMGHFQDAVLSNQTEMRQQLELLARAAAG